MRGIYKITNKKNNKIYIGETLDIIKRWNEHKEHLNKNKHHNYKLQNDWNTYGQDTFEFEIIKNLEDNKYVSNNALFSKILLICYEGYYINKLNTIEEGDLTVE